MFYSSLFLFCILINISRSELIKRIKGIFHDLEVLIHFLIQPFSLSINRKQMRQEVFLGKEPGQWSVPGRFHSGKQRLIYHRICVRKRRHLYSVRMFELTFGNDFVSFSPLEQFLHKGECFILLWSAVGCVKAVFCIVRPASGEVAAEQAVSIRLVGCHQDFSSIIYLRYSAGCQ